MPPGRDSAFGKHAFKHKLYLVHVPIFLRELVLAANVLADKAQFAYLHPGANFLQALALQGFMEGFARLLSAAGQNVPAALIVYQFNGKYPATVEYEGFDRVADRFHALPIPLQART